MPSARHRFVWAGLAALLAGCQIVILPPDDGVVRVSAGEGVGEPVALTLPRGEPLRLEVSVSAAQVAANDQLLVLTRGPEGPLAGGAVRLRALQEGRPSVQSTGPDFFAPAPDTATAALRAQQTAGVRCSGPCVALPLPSAAGTLTFELESADERSVLLSAFVAPFEDPGEPANDALETPRLVPTPPTGATATATGALEVALDEDFFQSELPVTQVSVSATEAPLELRFDVYTEDRELIASDNPAGSTYTVPSNVAPQSLIARVYAASGRAAPAPASSYTVTFSAVVPLSGTAERP
ncbi:hypothetical protein [Truepera radiovictrix]|uniref:Lipoprotein n=1 Tax=Truepera radiovictrix (strain DSM 17093 / CIP 108686 / LMG 22925 / RQ-24) TaxID=649638 RepID=D7CU52_TRURR|nr:hypothetical protein [Truepera radiovictrix]ADI13950.1 hypothetical protein Trad_0816 [Truepera radiovictrix DSM 17093]WMT57486.1 hypothetical protein RCV51_00750 [Truepera radiovictrix]